MGTQTYEPTAPYNKQIKEISKYPRQREFGFRIVGMGVHQPSGEYEYWDKNYGVSLTTIDEVTNALSTFFRCNDNEAVVANTKKKRGGNPQYFDNTLSVVIDKLNQIKDWFEVDNPSLAFYASSILIVYEGDYIQGDDEKIMGSNNEEPVVKIIDFAHVCRQTGTDIGYITGVRNLINIVEELRSKHSKSCMERENRAFDVCNNDNTFIGLARYFLEYIYIVSNQRTTSNYESIGIPISSQPIVETQH